MALTHPPHQLHPAHPTSVLPHGGPHSVTTSAKAFKLSAAFFVQLGYNTLPVNYRGSLSWGQGTIKALKGRCSELDVLRGLRALLPAAARLLRR